MRLRTLVPFLFGAVALVSACSKDATAPSGTPGSLSFSYSGARSGSFTSTGFAPDVRTGSLWTTPWVSATNGTDPTGTYTQITANLPTPGASEVVSFIVPNQTGTYAVDSLRGVLVFDYRLNNTGGIPYKFAPVTVTVTSVSATRMAGTFSGVVSDSVNSGSITLTNGSFDVNTAP